MANSILGNKNIRMASDDIEYFNRSFEASGCNSQGDFVRKMMDKWNEPEQAIAPEIRHVTVEKQLDPNEILVNLTPAQMYAIRQTVLSSDNFAQEQNEIIESLKSGNKPFMYFGSLFEPEFQLLWVKNIVLAKTMTPEQKENAIRHNMSAFLVNKFLLSLIEGKISCTKVTAEVLKSVIKKQIEDAKPKQIPAENPPD